MTAKLCHIIILIVFCIIIFESVICQQRRGDRRGGPKPKPRTRGRGRKPVEEPVEQRVNCYFCSYNAMISKFNSKNLCYNPGYNFTATDNEYLTSCPKPSKFCTVDITRIGGGLVMIDRKCGGATCNYFCINKGYGVEIETCTFCCPGKPVINEDELEEGEQRPKYKCP